MFHFEIFAEKLSYNKTYVFRENLIPDAFEHVRWQNNSNRYRLHQILTPKFDYAWLLMKRINYQNVTQLYNLYALGLLITYYGPRAGPKDNLVNPMIESLGPYKVIPGSPVRIPVLLRMPCVIPGWSTRDCFGYWQVCHDLASSRYPSYISHTSTHTCASILGFTDAPLS